MLYFDYTISVTVQDIPLDLDYFPAVTVCNKNPFDSSKSKTLKYLKSILNKYNILTNLTISGSNEEDFKTIFLFRRSLNLLKSNVIAENYKNSSELYGLRYTLDDMLISCFFNGVECNSSDFYYFYTFDYGNCFTFNSALNGNTHTTSKTGPRTGLSLELFTGIPGY